MSQDAPKRRPAGRLGKWLKRLFLGFLVVLLLVVAFHRPLFFYGARFAIDKGAEAAGLKVDCELGGSIFGSLRIWNLKVTPIRPGPVEKLAVGTLALDYSLPGLVRNGLAGLLQSVELTDVDAQIKAESRPEPKPKKKKGELRIPPLFPKRLRIENVNLVVRDDTKGDLVVRDFDFILHPTEKGKLSVEQLTIPGVHEWKDIHAASATYRDRNLVIDQLRIDSEVDLSQLNLDASKLDQAQLGLVLDGEVFGGNVRVDANVRELNRRNLLDVKATLNAISLGRITTYLNLDPEIGGSLQSASIAFEGNPSRPVTWTGQNVARLADLTVDGKPIVDAVGLTLAMSEGTATFRLDELRRASSSATANAEMQLPKKLAGFPNAKMEGRLSIDAPSLAELNPGGESPIEGAITAKGPFQMESGYFDANLTVEARGVRSEKVDVEEAGAQVRVRKRLYKTNRSAGAAIQQSEYMQVANTGAPEPQEKPAGEGIGKLLQGLEFEIDGKATGLRVEDFTADSATIKAEGKDGRIDLKTLEVREGDNVFSVGGEVVVPAEAKSFDEASVDADVKLSAPVLRQFVAEKTGVELEGALTVGGKLTRSKGKLNGSLDIRGKDLNYSGLLIDAVNVGILIKDNVAEVGDFELVFDKKNRVDLTGSVSLDKPISYKGQLDLKLQDLGLLNPLLKQQGTTISGSLVAEWEGEGKLVGVQHSGKIDLEAKTVNFGEITVSEATIGGDYSPKLIDIPTFVVKSNQGDLSMKVALKDEQLQISDLVVTRGEDLELTGEIGLPLDLSHFGEPAKMFPPDGKVAAAVAVKEVKLGPLLAKGGEPPLTGSAKATLTAAGPISDLSLNLVVEGSELQSTALERLEPASVVLSVKAENDRLTVDGSVKQPAIQPISIRGELPLDLEKLLADKAIDKSSPIKLDVTLPRSQLEFLTRVSPAVRFVEGSGTVNATVRGTLEAPELGGSINAEIASLALADNAVPPASDLVIDIRLAENTVSVNRANAVFAGGSVSLGGTIGVEDLANPVFDLRLVSENALVFRNDTVTVRVDTDVTVKGPLKEAAVAGSVAITNSRFFREIDILPLELPGEPAPVPPPTATGISLDEPFANWTFDVAVTTKDPFLIRGNLANGGATVDLKLVGKGSGPSLDGSVKIVDFVASLPFSRLTITNGFVYFSKDAPFEPNLDIQGESFLRDYRISVYIYGPATDPQTIFTSEPPLPQEDIISLLATGTTTEELTGSSGVVAGRAGALLAQKLWRTVFKPKRKAGEEPNPFMDRFDVDIGAVDPKTGEQEVRASFRMTKRFELIGGLDIRGNARGEVRYLIRFK